MLDAGGGMTPGCRGAALVSGPRSRDGGDGGGNGGAETVSDVFSHRGHGGRRAESAIVLRVGRNDGLKAW